MIAALSDINANSVSSGLARLWQSKRLIREKKFSDLSNRPAFHYAINPGYAKADKFMPPVPAPLALAPATDQILQRLERIERALAPQAPADLATQSADGNAHLCWILRQCQITRDGTNLTINFPSKELEDAFLTEEHLTTLTYRADAMGIERVVQQVNGVLSAQWGVAAFIAYEQMYRRVTGKGAA